MGFFTKLFDKSKNVDNEPHDDVKRATDTQDLECSETAKDIIELLGLEYTIIPYGTEIGDILKLFNSEVVKSFDNNWSYRPIFIIPSDTLYETLIMNLNDDEPEINRETIDSCIKNTLGTPFVDGERYFSEKLDNDPFLKSLEIKSVDDDVYGIRDFVSIYNDELSEDGEPLTKELIFVRVPVSNPWEVFAYLPFGGWNECPDSLDLMAVSKYWHEKHGAVPFAIGFDTLEFSTRIVRDKVDANLLAKEMYLFCSDIVDQGVGSVDILSEIITDSDAWYFWWD